MFPVYRAFSNAHALRAVMKVPQMPDYALAVGDDEYHASIPLTIFANQHQPAQRPLVVDPAMQSYEKAAIKGAGMTVEPDMFEMQDFDIGSPFDSI